MYRTHVSRFHFSANAILAIVALSALPSMFAESTPTPEWSLVTVTTIRPEMRADYESWQKEVSAAYKKAEVPSRAVLQTVMGNLLEYVSVTPLAHFADMDGLSPIERAMGKTDAAGFMRKGGAYITSAHRVASRDLNDLSIRTKTSE